MTVQQLIDQLMAVENKNRLVVLAVDRESGIFTRCNEITEAIAEQQREDIYLIEDCELDTADSEGFIPAIILWPDQNSVEDEFRFWQEIRTDTSRNWDHSG